MSLRRSEGDNTTEFKEEMAENEAKLRVKYLSGTEVLEKRFLQNFLDDGRAYNYLAQLKKRSCILWEGSCVWDVRMEKTRVVQLSIRSSYKS